MVPAKKELRLNIVNGGCAAYPQRLITAKCVAANLDWTIDSTYTEKDNPIHSKNPVGS
jgi:hypothetical protein